MVIVKERTNEIGIRRAVGAGPGSIIGEIVLESIVLTTAAGYLGMLLGVGLVDLANYGLRTMGANSTSFASPDVALGTALQALGILIVAGALAGLIPAQRAIRINTVEALRST